MSEKSRYWLVSGGILALVIVVWAIWAGTAAKPYYPEINSPRPVQGSGDAKIVLEEFSDFQCPSCKAAQGLLKEILATFGSKIKFSYRHYPLVSIHTQAFRAALAAECANDQGSFWPYHDKLFEVQPAFSADELVSYAKDLGLKSDDFKACLDSRAKNQIIRDDMKEGDSRGITGTPTFFLNGERVEDWTTLKEKVQAKLIGG